MTHTIYNQALDKQIETGRIIGHIKGTKPGPTVVFLGGIHGNEPAGLFALHQVYEELLASSHDNRGEFYAVAGNLWALSRKKRYDKYDLNRLWTSEGLEKLKHGAFCEDELSADIQQQEEIFQCLQEIFRTAPAPYYFFDLHTTSSETEPFITINDTLLNRTFACLYPVTIILGIEEFLQGPLLSYINELGYLSIGFEAGQHDALSSFENHRAFIYLSLVHSGFIDRASCADYERHLDTLGKSSQEMRGLFEIGFRHEIQPGDAFAMKAGYRNFQVIRKREHLAQDQHGALHAPMPGRIFMPLYQAQGDDGYFIIRKIPRLALRLSAVLRRWRSHTLLVWLPGVSWHDRARHILKVDTRVARFLTKQVFHLLGYRSRQQNDRHIIMSQREYHTKADDYRAAPWNRMR